MEKTVLAADGALIVGLVFIGGVLAQGTSPQGVFSGIITKVNPEGTGIAVQNKDGEMSFQLGGETRINGSFAGERGAIPDSLKGGMLVTISYMEKNGNKLANRIDVETSSVGTSKSWELPFGCGFSVC